MAKRILVVDDEKLIVKGLKFSLEQDGYLVDTAFDGEMALEQAGKNGYDLIILDVMLPGKDGMEVLRQIRERSMTPVMMLTAKGDDMDKILGLEYGADDYITKPFNILEVKARMKAILRRNEAAAAQRREQEDMTLAAGLLSLRPESRQVFMDGREIVLTVKEFDLLEHLMRNPNKVYSRENLLSIVWGYDYPGDVRTVDVHIRRLREKIERTPGEPEYIMTKWGIGYYFSLL
ncbi:DNA-binding response regulator [Lachnospiraceae bacterium oral taxon 500]|nr:DNA-binding response regulator [Lachnospiraceae bacterium oral taxon 500]